MKYSRDLVMKMDNKNTLYLYAQETRNDTLLHFDHLSPEKMLEYTPSATAIAVFEVKEISSKKAAELIHSELEEIGYRFQYRDNFFGKTINSTWFFVSEEEFSEIIEDGATAFARKTASMVKYCVL